jgi:MbtH protein
MDKSQKNDLSIDGDVFTVLINDEEQYALWPAGLPIAAGWREAGPTGSRETCRDFVDQVWTDMRPLSLRRARLGAEHKV